MRKRKISLIRHYYIRLCDFLFGKTGCDVFKNDSCAYCGENIYGKVCRNCHQFVCTCHVKCWNCGFDFRSVEEIWKEAKPLYDSLWSEVMRLEKEATDSKGTSKQEEPPSY